MKSALQMRRSLVGMFFKTALFGAGIFGTVHFENIAVLGNDWSGFRGPNGHGVSNRLNLADQISLSQVAWKIDSGKGSSSLVASKDSIFMTSYEGEKRTLRCLDAKSGKEIWAHSLTSLRKETATPPNDPATCTPVCDDTKVFAWFPDAGLIACNLDGKLLWQKDLGPFYSMHGISASPQLVQGKLILAIDQLQDPYILALDSETGKELWKVERLIGVTGGYSSPVAMEIEGKSYVLSAAPGELVGYDLSTGERAFSTTGLTNAPVGVPVVDKNRIYYSEPPGEPIPMEALGPADKNKDGVIELDEVKGSLGTFRLIERIDTGYGNSDGKVEKDEWDKAFGTFLNKGGLSCVELSRVEGAIQAKVVWKYTKSTPYIPSALVLEGVVYIINDGGVLTSFDADSGDPIKRSRLAQATGQYYSSPVSDGERLIFANMQGQVSLVKSGREWQPLSMVDLEEAIVATPMIHQGRLYVRTQSTLFCFSDAK